MSVLNEEAVGLSAIVSNAAAIGMQLSGKVRQLDVAKACCCFHEVLVCQNRVQNVEALVGDIITLCNCLDDTQKALESNDVARVICFL